jgi:YesN/AraC family two-component response regulator
MNLHKNVRVLIAEDDFMVRQMIRGRVEDVGYTVAGEALDGQQAVQMTESLEPNVVLMDIKMPDVDGKDFWLMFRTSAKQVGLPRPARRRGSRLC